MLSDANTRRRLRQMDERNQQRKRTGQPQDVLRWIRIIERFFAHEINR